MMKMIDRQKVIEMGRPSHTEKLAKWINKAQYELRSKQLARLKRWQRLKKELLKDVTYGSCALHHAAEAEREKERLYVSKITAKQKELCEELKGLDDFFQQALEILD